jgi:hypothetical protein
MATQDQIKRNEKEKFMKCSNIYKYTRIQGHWNKNCNEIILCEISNYLIIEWELLSILCNILYNRTPTPYIS